MASMSLPPSSPWPMAREEAGAPLPLRVLFLGNSSVGKTCILLRFTNGIYDPTTTLSTIGVDFKVKRCTVGRQQVKLTLWDTAGQEKYRSLAGSFYHGAHGIVFVFDLASRESFVAVRDWMKEVTSHAHNAENMDMLLLGNKCDLPRSTLRVTRAEAEAMAAEFGMPYYETSARLNVAVQAALDDLCARMVATERKAKAAAARAAAPVTPPTAGAGLTALLSTRSCGDVSKVDLTDAGGLDGAGSGCWCGGVHGNGGSLMSPDTAPR